jgi:hypothetical protein
MQSRKRLSDLFLDTDRESLGKAWDATEAAAEFTPLPAGEYLCRCLSGELITSKNGTRGYKLALEVAEGDHAGRRCWHDLWLTPAALPMAKRDLAKIGVVRLEQLDQPLPPGILVRVRLSLRRDDDGTERNRVTRMEAAGVEPGDAFAPESDPDGDQTDTSFEPATFDGGQAQAPTATPSSELPSPPTEAPAAAPSASRGRQRKGRPDTLPLSGDGASGSGPYGEGR